MTNLKARLMMNSPKILEKYRTHDLSNQFLKIR